MYHPPHFTEKDRDTIISFMREYPFVTLIINHEGKSHATQIPVMLREEEDALYITGHVSRHTGHYPALEQSTEALLLFTGAHCYISASWYSRRGQASTWNYMSVHVKGFVRFLDAAALENVLRKTSLHFENDNPHSTTVFDNVPTELKQRIMHLIVPFEIEVVEIDTVFKLSQDRDAQSYRNIIEKLKKRDESGRVIAAEMEKRADRLFPENIQ